MTEEHFNELREYERKLAKEGYTIIGGVDEAGRGPLAGPVAAACVIVRTEGSFAKGADDSKKISEKKREALYDEIRSLCVSYGVSMVGNERIDEINILQATYEAMRAAIEKATEGLKESLKGDAQEKPALPQALLVDHVSIPGVSVPQISITHGDARSVTIASASILAKVERDRLMKEYDVKYPQYGFAGHKGYGTKAHCEAIEKYGPCEIHRLTFLKGIYGKKG